MLLTLTLDDYTFDQAQLEVPENLAGVGGITSIAEHDFPGGLRTHQVFGAFPEPVKWKARFLGTASISRMSLIRQKLGSQTEQILSWGDRTWAGRLVKFSPVTHHQWLSDYECEFWVRRDMTLAGATAQLTSEAQAQSQSAVLNLQADALADFVTTQIGGVSNLTTLFPLVSASLLSPVTAFVSAVQAAMLNAGGNITQISVPDRAAANLAANAALAVATPLTLSAAPTVSSPASDVTAYVTSMQGLIATASPAAQWVIGVVNPNMLLLAAQYLGDATLWQKITDLNGLHPDPQPVGYFPSLMIPPP